MKTPQGTKYRLPKVDTSTIDDLLRELELTDRKSYLKEGLAKISKNNPALITGLRAFFKGQSMSESEIQAALRSMIVTHELLIRQRKQPLAAKLQTASNEITRRKTVMLSLPLLLSAALSFSVLNSPGPRSVAQQTTKGEAVNVFQEICGHLLTPGPDAAYCPKSSTNQTTLAPAVATPSQAPATSEPESASTISTSSRATSTRTNSSQPASSSSALSRS